MLVVVLLKKAAQLLAKVGDFSIAENPEAGADWRKAGA